MLTFFDRQLDGDVKREKPWENDSITFFTKMAGDITGSRWKEKIFCLLSSKV